MQEQDVQVSTKKPAKIDASGRSYATGKRKNAISKVWVKRGNGSITVNDKKLNSYFPRKTLQKLIMQPMTLLDDFKFDVTCYVKGGGISGQAGAIKHGISTAILLFDDSFRTKLKQEGFLTRDSRKVERKKYGKKKARRSFQFSKR